MDVSTLVGIIFAASLVITAIIVGGPGGWFVDYPALMIVLGGTMGATLLNYPLREILGVFRVLKNVFFHRTHSTIETINLVVEFAKKARRDGILSFEARLREIDDPFLVRGLELAVDGTDTNAIYEIMTTEIRFLRERHKLGAEIFTTMGTYAPAMGLVGTLIGLVQMLMMMQDPSKIGQPMAIALIATFYGVVLCNLIFLPIAGKLKTKSKQEILLKELMLEGILSIQSGDNPRIVEQKLMAFLSPKERSTLL